MGTKKTARPITRSEFNALRREVAQLRELAESNTKAIEATMAVAQSNFRRCAEVQVALDRLLRKLDLS